MQTNQGISSVKWRFSKDVFLTKVSCLLFKILTLDMLCSVAGAGGYPSGGFPGGFQFTFG